MAFVTTSTGKAARASERAFGGNAAKLADDVSAAVSRKTPRPLPGTRRSRVAAVVGDQVVLPIAEQGQMLVGQPLQEGAAFGHLRRRQGRGRGIELGDRLAQAGDHRLPVFDGRAHVAEHALDPVHQVCALLRVDQSIDLDVHPRFARGIGRIAAQMDSREPAAGVSIDCEDGMHDQVQRQPLAIDLGRRRVDQERHVVVDDLDHRMPRSPAVLGHRGAEDADFRLARHAHRAELPVRQQRTGQVLRRTCGKVIVVESAKVLARETFEHRSLLGGHMGRGEREDGIEPFATQRIGRGAHRQSPLASRGPKKSGASRGLF